MGTIQASIQMFGGLTSGLKRVENAINITTDSFKSMETASAHSFNISALQLTRSELGGVGVALQKINVSIGEAGNQQQALNSEMNHGAGMATIFDGVLANFSGMDILKNIVSMSDELSISTAHLGMLAGGMENVSGIQDRIYQSAQRTRSSYLDTMDTVGKLGFGTGSIFKNSDETIAFVEQLNKQFKIAGASQQEISSATLQLTQGLGAGVIQGDNFNDVFRTAPNIMESVADYLGVSKEKLGEMASQGMITGDILKNALFAAADETEANFKNMPSTWTDVWVMSVNKLIKISQPLLQMIGTLANNWSMMEPIIAGVVAILGLYLLVTKGAAMVQTAFTAVQTFLSIGFGVLAGNTAAASAAMLTYNSALLACPFTWVILAVIALIAIFYAVIAVINKVMDTSFSATGLIFGAFAWLGAAILNVLIGVANAGIQFIWALFVEPFISIIEWVLNVANGGFNSFGGAVANLIGQIISWFLSLGMVVTKIIDAIFGTNWTDGLALLQSNVLSWGKNEDAITVKHEIPGINRIGLKNAFGVGNNFGKSIGSEVTGVFGNDPTKDVISNVESTAVNTGRSADAVEVSQEEISYLRDMAEREAINRFTTSEIKVDFKNEAIINSDLDIDGVMNKFTEKIREAVYTEAEGVHAVV